MTFLIERLKSRRNIAFATALCVACVACVACGACGGSNGAPVTGTQRPATPTPNAPITPQVLDCTATNAACPVLTILGDAPYVLPNGAQSSARGYADPSIRRDPAAGTLWLAYSWPHLTFASATQATVTVSNHLARSDDGGVGWRLVGSLWNSAAEVGKSGAAGYSNHEVVSLAPRTTPAGTVWYSVRLQYFTTSAGGPDATSFRIRVASAASPDQLSTADDVALGGTATDAYWHPDRNISALSSDLTACLYNDPAIITRADTLYLAMECEVFDPAGEHPEREFVAVFSTLPAGAPRTWSWRYNGKLATSLDAAELGGSSLFQTDLVLGADGALLAIFSPSAPASPLATHFGCRIVEVASLSTPQLARGNTGRLRVRANITASDLQANGGPAACGYDPASATGVLITRRVLGGGQLVVSLQRTGLRP